jgi:hypothetical protein
MVENRILGQNYVRHVDKLQGFTNATNFLTDSNHPLLNCHRIQTDGPHIHPELIWAKTFSMAPEIAAL